MKRTLIVISVLLPAFMACERINETYEDIAPQLEVTSPCVVFGAGGGTKTVLVTSNVDWDFFCDADWLTVSRGDGALDLTASANGSSAGLQTIVTVSAGAGEELVREISVAQICVEAFYLSENGTANCYMTRTGTTCMFDATVKGCGLDSRVGGVGAYIDRYGLAIDEDEIVYADLLWESVFDGDKTRSHGIIDGDPVYFDGRVYFTTGESEGNAVIAVKNVSGEILWSWHIWVCNSDVEEIEGNGYFWQDRNLGATVKEPGDINNRGLLYQWGRKDPFLPSCAAYDAANPDVLNFQVGDGSGEWNYTDYIAKIESTAPGNIPVSVRKPMSVILAYGSVYSWYLTRNNEAATGSLLWGDSSDLSSYVKSIFDPCPPGYTVPVSSAWQSTKDANVGVWSSDADFGLLWTGGSDAYYPLSGGLVGTDVSPANTSVRGYYWSSGMYSSGSYYTSYLYFSKTSISYSGTYPVQAMSVRCMRKE